MLVAEDDPEELAGGIRQLLTNAHERAELSDAARARGAALFTRRGSWERHSKAYETLAFG
jgi:glycosyltransferase involved in cell wall biosynthesis